MNIDPSAVLAVISEQASRIAALEFQLEQAKSSAGQPQQGSGPHPGE